MIYHEPVQSNPRPLIILDVCQARNLVKFLQVLDTLPGLLLDFSFLLM